jgi:hypothetical protein
VECAKFFIKTGKLKNGINYSRNRPRASKAHSILWHVDQLLGRSRKDGGLSGKEEANPSGDDTP